MIRYFDMFAGIGGFRVGFDRAGGFRCVGHCEIDKYADAGYRAIHDIRKEECFYPDARDIDPAALPDFDLLCGGFPCQSFSLAGKRKGFKDPRGTLFFEISRLAESRRPPYLLLENVPGILNHDKGQTFAAILRTLSDLGYGVEWMVLNSADFGVPQARRRVYLVGYLDRRCAGKILPVPETTGPAVVQVLGGSQGKRVYSTRGSAVTQLAKTDGRGNGLYFIDLYKGNPTQTALSRCITADYGKAQMTNRKGEMSGVLYIKEATKRGYAEAAPGDAVNLAYSGSNTRRDTQRGPRRSPAKRVRWGEEEQGSGGRATSGSPNESGLCDDVGRIRRLMPRECLRLQGFAEDQIDRLLAITSDAQAYKQAGNSVTVNVIEAIGRNLRAVDAGLKALGGKAGDAP